MEKGLNCQTCTPTMMKARGHDGFEKAQRLAGYEIERCPLLYATASDFALIEAYRHYKNGYLPNDGGWLSQPAKLMESLGIIEAQLEIIEREREKENGEH